MGDPSKIQSLRRQVLSIRQEWSSLPWGVTGAQTWKEGGSRAEHPPGIVLAAGGGVRDPAAQRLRSTLLWRAVSGCRV